MSTHELRYLAALEGIENHFLPGDHERVTYSSDARGVLREIRDAAREALATGCPCVGTGEEEHCPHQ